MTKEHTTDSSLRKKMAEPRTIYLVGGGASFCAGLPGISKLTRSVHTKLGDRPRTIFEQIVECLVANGIETPNIEEVLCELGYRLGSAGCRPGKRKQFLETYDEICRCIQKCLEVDSSTEYHRDFIQRLVSRRKAEPAAKAPPVQIFTTNYDLLLEFACEETGVVAINGFEGFFNRRWNPSSFHLDIGKATNHVKTPRFEPSARHVRLYKLHGSLSWFEDNGEFYEQKPASQLRRAPLIIYPTRLKYAESIRPPFDLLLREFARAVSEAGLLVCIGYSFGDKHLNQHIFSGLNSGVSLLVLSKNPIDAVAKKCTHPQVSMINRKSTLIDGTYRSQVTDLWAFEKFAKWLPALKGK